MSSRAKSLSVPTAKSSSSLSQSSPNTGKRALGPLAQAHPALSSGTGGCGVGWGAPSEVRGARGEGLQFQEAATTAAIAERLPLLGIEFGQRLVLPEGHRQPPRGNFSLRPAMTAIPASGNGGI